MSETTHKVRSEIDDEPKEIFQWLTWKKLNAFGNILFLRISYAVLVGVPLWAAIQQVAFSDIFQDVPLTLRLGYFSSLILSLAHMIYQGYCPQVIRRFDSPNDLYRDMLQIKALQKQYLQEDAGFSFDIDHCRKNFKRLDVSASWARILCGLLYGAGLLIFAWLVIERTLIVLDICTSSP